jgi:DNA polymerase-3 subunit gamma/tau
MRDSLSILDKIVSFTNGEVTYQNTLEHLNILDEDYFFKLLEAMQQQDMAAAMMLYDAINRKGFEGDLVLNGFAEFIRNLLVCKDPKSASLLEVVEGLQDKYMSVAANTAVSYLVSALNVLNDAEIHFKMARNKRLHVELCLIKLNFLQQAIQLASDKGSVVKKKRIDGPIAYRTKIIQPLAPQNTAVPAASTSSAKLIIEQPAVFAKPAAVSTINATAGSTTSNSLPQIKPIAPAGAKKSLLDALREKAGAQYDIQEVKEAEILQLDKLQEFWDGYTAQLEKQLKHSAAGTFKIAGLEIESDIHFTVTVSALTAQRFVEHEKLELLEQLHKTFNNRAINFTVLVAASEKEDVPLHLRLNSKQKYERIAEQYPLLRELKEKLKLEIDY